MGVGVWHGGWMLMTGVGPGVTMRFFHAHGAMLSLSQSPRRGRCASTAWRMWTRPCSS